MDDAVSVALSAAAVGQAAFCAAALALSAGGSPHRLTLAGFMVLAGFVSAGPTVAALAPTGLPGFVATSLPAFLALPPVFWLYVQSMTAETRWTLRQGQVLHGLPAALGVIAAAFAWGLAPEDQYTMFVVGDLPNGTRSAAIAIALFALVLLWIVLSAVYVIASLRQLAFYRARLRDLFSNNDHRELHWLTVFSLTVCAVWATALAAVVADNFGAVALLDQRSGLVLSLGLIGFLGIWGLRQQPGFEGRYKEAIEEPRDEPRGGPDQPDAKYQRSALTPDIAARIAAKLAAAMDRDRLFLDPTLSLRKLSRHIGHPVNHVSQTLNETLGIRFFDYVNRARVLAAKADIAEGSKTVLEIAYAVGFNSRSAFYTAFRRETGQTPGDYRRRPRHDQSPTA